jgi:hypothetical protein
MRQNSCAIYFHANSWANFFCLTWGILASMLAFFTKNNPADYDVVYCKIRFYMINFSQWSSRTFLVLACFDRFFLCSTSVHQRNLCRPVIAKKVIVFNSVYLCLFTSLYFGNIWTWTTDNSMLFDNSSCRNFWNCSRLGIYFDNTNIVNEYFEWIDYKTVKQKCETSGTWKSEFDQLPTFV